MEKFEYQPKKPVSIEDEKIVIKQGEEDDGEVYGVKAYELENWKKLYPKLDGLKNFKKQYKKILIKKMENYFNFPLLMIQYFCILISKPTKINI